MDPQGSPHMSHPGSVGQCFTLNSPLTVTFGMHQGRTLDMEVIQAGIQVGIQAGHGITGWKF